MGHTMQATPRPLIVGNWKMNPQSVGAAERLAADIKDDLPRTSRADVVIAPPFVYLDCLRKVRNKSKKFVLCAQNTHAAKMGTYTGEVSLPMLKSLEVTHVILGHSERRAAGETDEEINKKIHATLKAGCTAIVCAGERERDVSGNYFTFVERQIRAACMGIGKSKLANLAVAYEPIWAISSGDGDGRTATAEDAHQMKLFIRKVLTTLYGRDAALKIRLLYGGSVNAKNAEELLVKGEAEGFLVGGASLRAHEFVEIVRSAR